jgi:argininosuccinate synthase
MPKYAELIYNGFWFSPEREALQKLIDDTQKFVTGTVRVKLYKVCWGVSRCGVG